MQVLDSVFGTKKEKDCNGPSTYGGSLSDFLVERELLMEVKQYFHSQM